MKKKLVWLVRGFLLGTLLFIALSGFFAYKLTGPRQRVVGAAPSDFPFPMEGATFDTQDGETLRGWFVPADRSEKALVLLHGYAGGRRQMLPRARMLREHGYATLLYDARACGESTGSAITFGYREAEDLVAAVGFLKQRGLQRIGCLGVSQGGATILLAAEHLNDVRCVVCESAFDELRHAVDNRYRHYTKTPGWLAGCLLVPFAEHRTGVTIDRIKPVDHIAQLRCPLFLISGEADPKTLPADARRLFDAARAPKELWMIPEAGHRDFFGQAGYAGKVLEFVQQHLK